MVESTNQRRQLLRSTGAACLGLNLWGLLRAQSAAEPVLDRITSGHIRSCIFVFLYGGPSHLETFDMKPDAPAEVRGEFQPIATSVPGVQICEHLPHLARVMDKVAIIRSMHHTNRLHDSASIETFTGRQGPNGDREEFSPISQFFPCHGAILNYLNREKQLDVPHAVLPWLFHNVIDVPCQGGGFLGQTFDPFQVKSDPTTSSYRSDILKAPSELNRHRIDQRRQLLTSLESATFQGIAQRPSDELNRLYEKAYDLLQSKTLKQALAIEQEPLSTREQYGIGVDHTPGPAVSASHAFGRNMRGQNLLMARRLVEAGVPFVNVNDFRQQGQNWDAHTDNFGQHKKYLLPQADQALAALIEDLDQRGLLESTLVVATGEFGRTPHINANAGRDHWPDCYSLLLAGGGIRGGSVYGSSDKLGAYPDVDAVTPADLAATVFWRFGINPATEIHDQSGRPYRLTEGKPVHQIFG